MSNSFLGSRSVQRNLDPLEVRYCYGYARMMAQASLAIAGDAETKALIEPLLDDVLATLYTAYCTSAVRGRPVTFTVVDGVIRWDSTQVHTHLSKKCPDRLHWKAYEDLPQWRESAYNPYLELVMSLPGLLTRLELIEIEDSELKKVLSPNEFATRIQQVSDMLNQSLRNDGFLVHGPGIKIKVHHRQSNAVVQGLEALKDHVLASTDYTELRLWGKRSVGGGLAGVDEADRAFEVSQVLTRLKTCWEPVLKLWIESCGLEPVTFGWVVHQDDRVEVAKTELLTAQTAKLNIESGVVLPTAYTNRYTGGESPGLYPEVEATEPQNGDTQHV